MIVAPLNILKRHISWKPELKGKRFIHDRLSVWVLQRIGRVDVAIGVKKLSNWMPMHFLLFFLGTMSGVTWWVMEYVVPAPFCCYNRHVFLFYKPGNAFNFQLISRYCARVLFIWVVNFLVLYIRFTDFVTLNKVKWGKKADANYINWIATWIIYIFVSGKRISV